MHQLLFPLTLYFSLSNKCRALAKAVLGDPKKIELIFVGSDNRFTMLSNRDVDLLSAETTHTMGRDIFEENSKFGLTFSVPFAYTGLAFAGSPEYVDCADNLDSFSGSCRDLKICLLAGSTHETVLMEIFPGPERIFGSSLQDHVDSLESGKCNVIAGDSVAIMERQTRSVGYSGPYKLGAQLYSKEPLALVTRDGDPEWSKLANLVVDALLTAEAMNITQDSVEEDVMLLEGIDEVLTSFFVDVISTVGNMAELYSRHLEEVFPRQGLSLLNRGETEEMDGGGLVYSFPFGKLEPHGVESSGGVIESILGRGKLRCGVSRRPGLAEFDADSLTWTGLDIEFCVALSAALFSRDGKTRIEFLDFVDTKDRFSSLAQGDVDVLAGERMTLLNSWQEPETKMGYSYSPPYFHDDENGDSLALMTRQDDTQWSGFVYWVVMSTFYAEENRIGQSSSTELPVVNLFGER
jgi:general L-amino acid transport system substrate-binding protein